MVRQSGLSARGPGFDIRLCVVLLGEKTVTCDGPASHSEGIIGFHPIALQKPKLSTGPGGSPMPGGDLHLT